jgi:hypothetical protein
MDTALQPASRERKRKKWQSKEERNPIWSSRRKQETMTS